MPSRAPAAPQPVAVLCGQSGSAAVLEKRSFMTTSHYQDQIALIAQRLEDADAVLVGGASGMSTANQHDFYGYSKYFRDHFGKFQQNYGIRSLCYALYHRYPSSEERWAYLAKHGALMYDQPPGQIVSPGVVYEKRFSRGWVPDQLITAESRAG